MSRKHDGRKPRREIDPATVRRIASQIRRMEDVDVYALTFSGDRPTRRLAMQEAHERAEAYALNVELSELNR